MLPPARDSSLSLEVLLAVGETDGAGIVRPLDSAGQAQHCQVIGQSGPLVARVNQDLINLNMIALQSVLWELPEYQNHAA